MLKKMARSQRKATRLLSGENTGSDGCLMSSNRSIVRLAFSPVVCAKAVEIPQIVFAAAIRNKKNQRFSLDIELSLTTGIPGRQPNSDPAGILFVDGSNLASNVRLSAIRARNLGRIEYAAPQFCTFSFACLPVGHSMIEVPRAWSQRSRASA